MYPSWGRNRVPLASKAIHLHINSICGLRVLGWDIRIHQAQFSAAVCLLEICGTGDYLTSSEAELLNFQRQATL